MKFPSKFPQCVALLLVFAGTLPAAMTVSVNASAPSPAPLGMPITWNASVSGADPGTLAYRFRVRLMGDTFRTVVDYGPKSSLVWTTIDQEGSYEVEVSVKNNNTGAEAVGSSLMAFTSLLSGGGPGLTLSANPQVFIYSAPSCAHGSRMRVQFQSADLLVQNTPYKPCSAGGSMNFYLAGLRPSSEYFITHTINTGGSLTGAPSVIVTTPVASVNPAVITPTRQPAPATDQVLLQSTLGTAAFASDLTGNVLWTGPADITYITRPVSGGTILGLGEDGTQDQSHQFFREFDLAGITVAETNAARVNEQLTAMGVHPINGFHHDARKLANGDYLVLANSERILTDVQGPGPVDVIGDTILVLNPDLQVTWAWDAFDHLDPHRMASLNEQCTYPAGLSCAPFYLSPTANDWLHGNAVQLTPDGDILYSARHQDWVIKIDYANGNGTGNILWRLGIGGDFQTNSSDPNPWFSHQHDPNFESNNTTLLLFDNGNLRAAIDPSAHSRGQALQVDEQNRVVAPLLNADLGIYSSAVGSAQHLPNGDYHFDAGFIMTPGPNGTIFSSESFEVRPSEKIDFGIQVGAAEYRTFRMRDLYTAP